MHVYEKLQNDAVLEALKAEANQHYRDIIRQCMMTLVPAIDKATKIVICMLVASRSCACIVNHSEAAERAKMMYHPDKEHRAENP
ncbi:unnamed protein product [Symbiodinium natans]|uniref:Uncharacterized protein n=1 Tax=Symbiodinium natans TaxID=878477 RepID=A0A812JFN3_9DINO|nr:unnamed protein product [Symbiodinium natans]